MKKAMVAILITGFALVAGLLIRAYQVQLQPKKSPTVITVAPGSLKANVKGNVTLACYDHKTNTIYLDTYHIRHSEYTMDQVLAHEMCHARQWREHPVYTALNHLLPYQIRPIEKEARNI